MTEYAYEPITVHGNGWTGDAAEIAPDTLVLVGGALRAPIRRADLYTALVAMGYSVDEAQRSVAGRAAVAGGAAVAPLTAREYVDFAARVPSRWRGGMYLNSVTGIVHPIVMGDGPDWVSIADIAGDRADYIAAERDRADHDGWSDESIAQADLSFERIDTGYERRDFDATPAIGNGGTYYRGDHYTGDVDEVIFAVKGDQIAMVARRKGEWDRWPIVTDRKGFRTGLYRLLESPCSHAETMGRARHGYEIA